MVALYLKIILLLKVEIMLSTKDLFEINPIIFKKMSYEEVLIFKKNIAKKLIKELHEVDYKNRDYHRVDQLAKAIKNMDKLLSEIKQNEEKETKCMKLKNKLKCLTLQLKHFILTKINMMK